MKKIICIILFIMFVLNVCSCSYQDRTEEILVVSEVYVTPTPIPTPIPTPEPTPMPTPSPTPEPTPTPIPVYTTDDEYSATIIAKIIYGEARGIWSVTEQACIAWSILNRVDADYGMFAWWNTIEEVATYPNQFNYSSAFPTVDDYGRDLVELAKDVIGRWEAEKNGETEVGRVLPSDYLWFASDGSGHNYFRNNATYPYMYWYYTLESPYDS